MLRPSTAVPRPSTSRSDELSSAVHAPVVEGSVGDEVNEEPQSSEIRSSTVERVVVDRTLTDQEPSSSRGAREEANALAGALHEVSNALTVVLGWLDAASQTQDPVKLRAALEVAGEHARRGRRLARRAIGAEDDSHCEPRGAGALASFAVMSMRPRAASRSVRLEVAAEPELDVALENEAPALQILTNLLLNAIDFSPPLGRVQVELFRDSSNVVFAVSDEGPGVSEDRQKTLFVDPVSTRRGGAGIGLRYSRSLAREHGGELRLVQSEVGARFELSWPRVRARSRRAPSARAALSSKSLAGARILVVEDDAAIGSLIELSLQARGAEVLLAPSAESLARILSGRPVIDAALLDLSPLEGNLKIWLDEIGVHARGAPLLLVSGHPSGVPEAAEGCFSAWIRKPFEMSELLETLGGLLESADDSPCDDRMSDPKA